MSEDSFINKYKFLEKKLLELRKKNGPVDSEEEDSLLEEMDLIWNIIQKECSEKEIKEINNKARVDAWWGSLIKDPNWKNFFSKK